MRQFIALFLVSTVLFACDQKPKSNGMLLPVFGEKKASGMDTTYHTIRPFFFKNQYNEPVTESTTKNKIYVADFFFATCQSICPEMSTQLVQVQEAFKNDSSVLILSHTVNPMHDTVEVLNGYAQSYGAIKGKWHFLTGNKKDIYALAKDSYLVNALEDDGTPEGFLHSELFMLIDTYGRIRGTYDGTDPVAVRKLIADIKLLKKETAS
jgi:protein SCO1/2